MYYHVSGGGTMKGRNTWVISSRIGDELYEKVQEKAARKNLTVSDWLKRLVEKELGMRPKI